MKDQDASCPLFDWSFVKGRVFLPQTLELRAARRVSHSDGFVGSQGHQHSIDWSSRGTVSGGGDWGTLNWSLWAKEYLNMSQEAITLVLGNWNLSLQMTAQLFGTLIRQSQAAVEILLIYYWTEKEKTSAKLLGTDRRLHYTYRRAHTCRHSKFTLVR